MSFSVPFQLVVPVAGTCAVDARVDASLGCGVPRLQQCVGVTRGCPLCRTVRQLISPGEVMPYPAASSAPDTCSASPAILAPTGSVAAS